MRIHKKMRLFVLGCMALLLIHSSFAYWSGEIRHTNKLTADVMNAKIVETFTQGAAPEGTVTKKVSFQNESSSAAFLRVAYSETWKKTEGDESSLLNNQIGGHSVAEKHWQNGFAQDSDLWQDGQDGWFYYKRILLPNASTDPVLESVTFPTYSGVYEAYADAEYQLYFRMELLQASDSLSTLNSAQVNAKASQTIFGKTAAVSNGIVSWQ